MTPSPSPSRRPVLRAALLSGALTLLPALGRFGAADARSVAVAPAYAMEIPDDWFSAPFSNGVEIANPAGTVRVRVVVGPAGQAQTQAMVEEQQAHLAARGVTITGVLGETQAEMAGLRYIRVDVAANMRGERTPVNLLLVGIPGRPERTAVVSLWMANLGVAQREMGPLGPIMNSLFASFARR